MRSSTTVPSWATAATRFSPRDATWATQSWATNASEAVSRLVTAATMSMSFPVSANRRRLPAGSHRTTASQPPSSFTIRSASGRSRPIDVRRTAAASPSFSPSRIASSVFWPIPPIPRIRCASAASRTWSTVSRPSSVKIRRAVFGPMPGMRITVVAPGGLRFTSLSSAAISPLPSSSATLAATVSPTPGSVVSRPSSESRATDSAVSRSDFAARR